MKIVAMNCPNCGGKLTSDGANRQLVCESCNSLVLVEEDVPQSQNKSLNSAQTAKAKELKRMLERYKQRIEGYKARGVLAPVEVESINRRYLKCIQAISPVNKSAEFLQNYLSAIEHMTISGIILSITLDKNGILSITDTGDGEVVYSNPLEKVAILSIQEPRLFLPGKAVFGTRNDQAGATITFTYSNENSTEIQKLVRYISKVAQIPNLPQQQPKPSVLAAISENSFETRE